MVSQRSAPHDAVHVPAKRVGGLRLPGKLRQNGKWEAFTARASPLPDSLQLHSGAEFAAGAASMQRMRLRWRVRSGRVGLRRRLRTGRRGGGKVNLRRPWCIYPAIETEPRLRGKLYLNLRTTCMHAFGRRMRDVCRYALCTRIVYVRRSDCTDTS